ncbi:MAG: sigma-54-dependent Fis family transcriptional regulator [Spirochaetales bacterium]|nr:sigma-54-dependent Fis family transcriptional regulator [Spirochaetales bacterium]
MISVLYIDDDVPAHKTMKMLLADEYRILSAYTGEQGLEVTATERPDVVLLDLNLPGINGIEVMKRIAAGPIAPPVIMISAQGDAASVVEAMQSGAVDYIVKPYDVRKLTGTIIQAHANAFQFRLGASPGSSSALDAIIGESAGIRRVKDLVAKCAASHAPVLISGKSGTGKELVATALHRLSPRAEGPFVVLNCGAIPLTLIETELFGSERGAFTDARSRPGNFERADGGTLFLDEIGEMPPGAQVKLLRALEEKRVTRVGATESVPVNVRFVAATNRDLRAMVAEGSFREDLYYRVGVLPIALPDLKDRPEDVVYIALHLIDTHSSKKKRLADDAREKLFAHSWPGNVRELRNVIERALIYAEDDTIRAKDIVF